MELKLGKKEAKLDSRTLKMAMFWGEVPTLPNKYDFDEIHCPSIPVPMFANDQFGCCVIAARAHQTMRFEVIEQGCLLSILDNNVTSEYFRESNGEDNGLIVLDSLKLWRNKGWYIGAKFYNIFAYGTVNPLHTQDVMISVCYLGGLYTGVSLPISAKKEFENGDTWTEMSDKPGSWGGHCMLIVAYDDKTVTFVTWGRKFKATWDWFQKYCDEAYAIVDDRDKFLEDKSPLDIAAMTKYLNIATS